MTIEEAAIIELVDVEAIRAILREPTVVEI